MTLRFTVLGCGSSAGVPRVGFGWGDCDPSNPKNRRRRCSLLVERHGEEGVTRILIDTAPDLREQLLDARVDHLDAVLLTHEHADQIHGIDDVRPLAQRQRQRIPFYFSASAAPDIRARFAYCFETPARSHYPPIISENLIEPGRSVHLDGKGGRVSALPFLVSHGEIPAVGFRLGGLAYTPDVNGIPDASLPALQNLDVWIVDALRFVPHPSHFNVEMALDWIRRIKPRQAILTNLSADVDFDVLRHRLPHGVEPAFDGMSGTVRAI
jgi:phosphoribosyl 1,2-cyclic phosphate phosphodiesterase